MKQQKMDSEITWKAEKRRGHAYRAMKRYEIARQTVASVEVVGDENVTVATASFGSLQGVGTARRAAGDPRDSLLGVNLATQRALENLVKRLKRQNDEDVQRTVIQQQDALAVRQERQKIFEEQCRRNSYNLTHPGKVKARREAGRQAREAAIKQAEGRWTPTATGE